MCKAHRLELVCPIPYLPPMLEVCVTAWQGGHSAASHLFGDNRLQALRQNVTSPSKQQITCTALHRT